VRRLVLLLVGMLPVLLAGCSVTWSMAATESRGNAVLHLPTCTTRSVADVRVVDEATFEPVWEIAAAEPVKGIRDFVVGESLPGFDVVVPLTAELAEDTKYYAVVRFGDSPGPVADVRFTTGDLSSDSWWFDGHVGTPESFESAAQDSGLCGNSGFSFTNIFWTTFGLGCAVVLLTLVGLVGRWFFRRRRARVDGHA
jgi:hypothetical protein